MVSFPRKFSLLLVGLGITLFFLGSLLLIAEPSWADSPKGNDQLMVVAGKTTVKHDKVEDFIALSRRCIEPSRAEAGSISYNLYQDETQANCFLFFEEWKNKAALDYHFQTPYFKEFMAQSEELLLSPPDIKIYNIDSFTALD